MKSHSLLITLFGATGDLAARKLYPAIYRLYKNKQISSRFALIGTARRQWSNTYFRQIVLDSIQDEIDDLSHAQEFTSHFYYQSHDVKDSNHYAKLRQLSDQLETDYQTEGNRIFYISLSPSLFPIITRELKNQKLLTKKGFNRLIIEKPFGYDYQSAKNLQDQLTQSFDESQIYRIDHYLGKEAIASIKNIRFNNTFFKALWNKDYIDNIQISLSENLGVEDRGGYYDQTGLVRDMIQNHTLQVLALLTMDQPISDQPEDFRQAKIDILNRILPYQSLEDLKANVVRGQYGPSSNGLLKGYRQEDKVNPDSDTETYMAAKLSLNHPKWEGVPIFIRSGKRLANKSTTIQVVFKKLDNEAMANRLAIEIAPNLIYQVFVNIKQAGYSDQDTSVPLTYHLDDQVQQAIPQDYERLIHDCIEGKLTNFTHWQEVAAAWRFIDSIHHYWKDLPRPDFPNYPAGSNGPSCADDLLKSYGTQWY